MNAKCSVCGKKDARLVSMKHWKTGKMQSFSEPTCGDARCLEDWQRFSLEAEMVLGSSQMLALEEMVSNVPQ